MRVFKEVALGNQSIERFAEVLRGENLERYLEIAHAARTRLEGRVVWNVNSTAVGGGVAEMLPALLAYTRLGCRDLARVDFIVDERGPWFLEINTMPGFTPHSLVPMAAAHTGRDMTMICGALVDAAVLRGAGVVARS